MCCFVGFALIGFAVCCFVGYELASLLSGDACEKY